LRDAARSACRELASGAAETGLGAGAPTAVSEIASINAVRQIHMRAEYAVVLPISSSFATVDKEYPSTMTQIRPEKLRTYRIKIICASSRVL
jgi:hypothetical protein